MSGSFHLANVGRFSGRDVEENVHLLDSGVRSALSGDSGAIKPVLLHELPNILQSPVEFIERVKFAELELTGIENLVRVGVTGSAFHINRAHKEVDRGGESEQYIRARWFHFSLDVGKPSRGEEGADAVADLVAIEWLARFLWKHLQQMIFILYARQIDGAHVASGVSRHSVESGGGLRGLHFPRDLRGRRRRRRRFG